MFKQIIFSTFLVFLISIIQIIPARAQESELQRQQNSLRGIRSFYLVVNVEGSQRVTQNAILNVTSLTKTFKDSFDKAGLTILSDVKRARANNAPYLLIHINTMDAGRGLIPFSVSINFYQPVKLTLNRSMPTLASTWESSAVGLVSMDRLKFITKAANGILGGFIRDYHHANRRY